jgi:hypothetical protein
MEKLRQILDIFKDTDSIFGSTDFRLVIDLLIKYELLKEGISENDQVLIALSLANRFTDIQNAIAAIEHNKQAVMSKTIRFLQDYEAKISKLAGYFEKEPIVGITIRYETKGKNRQLRKEEIELLISNLGQTKDIHLSRVKKKLLGQVKEEEIEESKWSLDFKSKKHIAKNLFQNLQEVAVNSEKAYLFIGEFMFLAGCPFYDEKGKIKNDFNPELFRQHVKNHIKRV